MPTIPPAVRDAIKYPIILMETGANAVVGGRDDQYGWISGNIDAQAAGTTVRCLFDLGPTWDQYPELVITVKHVGPSTGASVYFCGRDDAVAADNTARQLGPRYQNAVNGQTYSAAIVPGTFNYVVRPAGRYLVATVINTDGINALGAGSKVTVAAYPS